MKRLVKVVRMSSKVAFTNLRNLGPLFSPSLGENIWVTNIFLRHISGSSKKRNLMDIVKRLSTINLVSLIISNGLVVEKRKDVYVEGKRYPFSYKIRMLKKKVEFYLVVVMLKSGKYILISSFYN